MLRSVACALRSSFAFFTPSFALALAIGLSQFSSCATSPLTREPTNEHHRKNLLTRLSQSEAEVVRFVRHT